MKVQKKKKKKKGREEKTQNEEDGDERNIGIWERIITEGIFSN